MANNDGHDSLLNTRVRGAVHVETTARGIRPRRLTREALLQVPDHSTRISVDQSPGVRLAFRTAARRVRMRVAATRVAHTQDAVLEPSWWDVTTDGLIVSSTRGWMASRYVQDSARQQLDYVAAPDDVLEFSLVGEDHEYEIWFPHCDDIEVVGLYASAPVYPPSPERQGRWIHHGGVVSHGYGASRATRTWPAVAAIDLQLALTNLSYAGCAFVDQFAARTIRDSVADFISLDLGSDTAVTGQLQRRVFVSAVHGFLDTIRDRHSETPILVMPPIVPPCTEGLAPHTPASRRCVERPHASSAVGDEDFGPAAVTRVLAELVDDRRTDDENLAFLDGSRLDDPAGLRAPAGAGCPPVTDQTHVALARRFVEGVRQTTLRGQAHTAALRSGSGSGEPTSQRPLDTTAPGGDDRRQT